MRLSSEQRKAWAGACAVGKMVGALAVGLPFVFAAVWALATYGPEMRPFRMPDWLLAVVMLVAMCSMLHGLYRLWWDFFPRCRECVNNLSEKRGWSE